jgi:hypothetical protein
MEANAVYPHQMGERVGVLQAFENFREAVIAKHVYG